MNKKEYQPLIIPRVAWNKESLTSTYGELTVQPLEPGFGITLGNALRRILLGGVEGSAVTAVIIEGVNNEFMALPGLVEDAMQIVLNIKGIIVQNKTGLPGKMSLHVSDQKVVYAGDISADDHLEILNKKHVIAHMASGGKLGIEFFVESGRGYLQAQWPIGQALQEDNRIYLDAMFSPVRKVTYDVEKTRVGRDIDYDKLILSIATDGTQNPVGVLDYAVSVLRTQLEHFLTTTEISFNDISKKPAEEKKEGPSEHEDLTIKGVPVDLLVKPIDILEFSVRANNCLLNAGIRRIIDLVNLSEEEVMKIKNFGSRSYEEVKERMQTAGLTFDMGIKESDVEKKLLKKGMQAV
jgi:DNA-directed RNA polymerase subunit alpha